jgi:citrate lyase beta subunit
VLGSVLFVPASDPRKVEKALASAAAFVVLDLEDAVAPEQKEPARAAAVEALREPSRPAGVRVNAVGTPWHEDDLAALRGCALDGIVLPKATPEAVASLALDADVPLFALIETSIGLLRTYDVAREPRVRALLLGAVDLGGELGLEARADGLELLYPRSKLVVESAAAGIGPPIDAVFLDFRDAAGLEEDARRARSLGFGGKACIHPEQVDVVNEVFLRADLTEWAARVVAAYEEALERGEGAVAVDGRMVDAPVYRQALRLLGRDGRV